MRRAVTTALLCCLAAPSARAYEERFTFELGGGPMVALAPGFAAGPGVEFASTFGIGRSAYLGLDLRYAVAFGDAGRLHLVVPGACFGYALDVASWVPRFELGLGPALQFAGPDVALDTYARLAIDRWTESSVWGLGLRLDVLSVGQPSGMPGVAASLAFRWVFVVDRY